VLLDAGKRKGKKGGKKKRERCDPFLIQKLWHTQMTGSYAPSGCIGESRVGGKKERGRKKRIVNFLMRTAVILPTARTWTGDADDGVIKEREQGRGEEKRGAHLTPPPSSYFFASIRD